jgi:hypothetical protein
MARCGAALYMYSLRLRPEPVRRLMEDGVVCSGRCSETASGLVIPGRSQVRRVQNR